MILGSTLPQGQAARDGLLTESRKRQAVADLLRAHTSLLCFGSRYAKVDDDKLIDAIASMINSKWS